MGMVRSAPVSCYIGYALWLRVRLHGRCISVRLDLLTAAPSWVERRVRFHGSTSRMSLISIDAVLCHSLGNASGRLVGILPHAR